MEKNQNVTRDNWETDEDRMIYNYQIHKNLVTWTIEQLTLAGVSCERTRGNDRNGDILISNTNDLQKVRKKLQEIHQKYNSTSYAIAEYQDRLDRMYVEIKGVYVYGRDIDDLINKGTVIGLVNAKNISKPGKQKLEEIGIAYADRIPESEFM